MDRILFKEYYKDYLTPLFTAIASDTRINTLTSLKALLNTTDAKYFELEYLNRSGNKKITNLLIMITDEDICDTNLKRSQTISELLLIKFGENWNRLLDTFYSDYNPIQNYDMVEEENQNTDISVDTSDDRNTFGFNTTSEDGVPMSKGNINQTTTGDFEKNHRKLTRSGNIGVTTSQQMIESEIELRRYNILNQIYTDMDTILTLSYLGGV
ncbi:MAG: hypothetical protein IKT40_14440 [Bacilli bacterium]|nr:hypothetical protein [Bacilli bacterium]